MGTRSVIGGEYRTSDKNEKREMREGGEKKRTKGFSPMAENGRVGMRPLRCSTEEDRAYVTYVIYIRYRRLYVLLC